MAEKFSPQDLIDAQNLLTELFAEVSSEEGTLAGGTKLGTGGNALQGLRETKVTFGNPTDNLIRLTQELFDDVGVELTEIRRRQMREQFDFYYMTLTVSMQPKRGALFTRVECALDFGPKGADEPIVQTIFPRSEWKEVLGWGGGMNLALNGNLDWGAEVGVPDVAKITSLPGHVKANIANKDELKAFVVVPDYAFTVGRAEIAATGEGNSECFWRIEKPSLQKAQTVQLGVVFKVPKGTTSIELTGLVAVEPSISWLVANVRNVFEDLSDKLQDLLRRRDDKRNGKERLPIGDHEKWIVRLPD
jgi:hypothetical protein